MLDKQNDWLGAAEAYDGLSEIGLSREQTTAVRTAIGNLYVRLNTAAYKGDHNAMKLLEAIKKNQKEEAEAAGR